MSLKSFQLSEPVYQYLLEHSIRESAEGVGLREKTLGMEGGNMQISPEQGQFMALLVELMGATRAVEVGTFTGYSALMVAQALPPEGRLVACDVSLEWTEVGRPFWRAAGVEHKIDLRLGPAVETLDGLLEDGQAESFDFAFIDADKVNYSAYYERCLALLRPGGVVLIDNVLWSGSVADPAVDDPDTEAIRTLNRHIRADMRVSVSMLPVGDGLTLARKR
jgi:O-methyltransferase